MRDSFARIEGNSVLKRSLIKIKQNVGEIIRPGGILKLVKKEEDDIPSTTTSILRFEIRLLN